MTRTVGDLVPSTTLSTTAGRSVRLRWPPHGTVVAVRLAAPTDDDLDRPAVLERCDRTVRRSGGRLVVLTDAPDAAARLSVPVTTDIELWAGRLGLPTDQRCGAAVIDRFGQIWQLVQARDLSGLPVHDLAETAGFVEIQCPECEVPDVPPGGPDRVRDTGGARPAGGGRR